AGVAVALALILEVILWPLLGLALLLGPIVVIDEGGVGASLARWCRLLREHPSRVIVYQALAAALGAVVVLPLVFPVVFAGGVSVADELVPVKVGALSVLGGLAGSPLFAYLVVANVYI